MNSELTVIKIAIPAAIENQKLADLYRTFEYFFLYNIFLSNVTWGALRYVLS
jgi:hypothetical protein